MLNKLSCWLFSSLNRDGLAMMMNMMNADDIFDYDDNDDED